MKFLHFKNLQKTEKLTHFITTRHGGVSTGLYSQLNLSCLSGDTEENVSINRKLITDNIKINMEQLLIPTQCHTSNIQIIRSPYHEVNLSETDGIITNLTEVCIGVLAADCVPILLFDPVKTVIGAIHAGWRGTVKEIQKKAIQLMINHFGCNQKNILAGIGPAICQDHYEVGKGVYLEFTEVFNNTLSFCSINQPSGKVNLNLQKANLIKLVESGVPEKNIEIANQCSYESADLFYSARRDGFYTGRFGAFIMLK